jgi:hypothetical protein
MTRGMSVPIGTRIKLSNGYYNVRTVSGWKLIHRAVMEAHLGRPLEADEWVRFINPDADKSDPKPEDLEVYKVNKKAKPEAPELSKQEQLEQLRAQLLLLLQDVDNELAS